MLALVTPSVEVNEPVFLQDVYSKCSSYQTQYLYDDKQRIEQIIDAEGNVVHYHYDDSKPWLSTLVKRVDYPDGNSIEMRYDDYRRLSQLTNENGETWIFEYDEGDNLISETRFDGHRSHANRYGFV